MARLKRFPAEHEQVAGPGEPNFAPGVRRRLNSARLMTLASGGVHSLDRTPMVPRWAAEMRRERFVFASYATPQSMQIQSATTGETNGATASA